MSLNLGSTELNRLYLGIQEINKAYLGSNEVFSGAGTIPVASFFGQSNMSGKGIRVDAPLIEQGVIPMSKVWNGGTLSWDDFETGVNNGNDTANYSLITKFAWLRYLDDPLTVKYYFITAIPETSMAVRWNSTTPEHAAILVDYANMLASGDFYSDFINWFQGESDCSTLVRANAYQESEALMIDSYKSSFGTSKFVSFKLGYDLAANPQLPYKAIVNAAKDTNQAGGKSTVLLETDGIPNDNSGMHFTTAGYQQLGQTLHDVYFDNGLDQSFKMIVTTTGASESYTLPIVSDDNSTGTIDWGDGSPLVDNLIANRTHIYATAGDYEIIVDGYITQFSYDSVSTSRSTKINITQFGKNQWNMFTSTRVFYLCSDVTISATDLVVSHVSSVEMFRQVGSLTWGANHG